MSIVSRREYVDTMRKRYQQLRCRAERAKIIDELVAVLGYHRKYAITVLNRSEGNSAKRQRRPRALKYREAMPAVQLVWEALDYACAERLHPLLVETADILAHHGEVFLTPLIREQLACISRTTLGRRISSWSLEPAGRATPRPKPSTGIKREVPIQSYAWNEQRPGALECDLVEHNGGSSHGHYAYTLSVVDVVSGFSRRRSVLGRGRAGVLAELDLIITDWLHYPWGLHTDNGSEFLNDHLVAYTKDKNLQFTRSRPYRKNDSPHVEQKNRQYVRDIVGYERYDTPEAVQWLNEVYRILDPYANYCLPMRKLIGKVRQGSRVKKTYDQAQTPFKRLVETGVLDPQRQQQLLEYAQSLNPLAINRHLRQLLTLGPSRYQLHSPREAANDD
jgi:hypothetical protein